MAKRKRMEEKCDEAIELIAMAGHRGTSVSMSLFDSRLRHWIRQDSRTDTFTDDDGNELVLDRRAHRDSFAEERRALLKGSYSG